jgi:hypothetical protein
VCSDVETLRRLESEDIPKVGEISAEVAKSLQHTEATLAHTEIIAARLSEEVFAEQSHCEAIEERLTALREDLKRNQDVKRLRDLGSVATLTITSGACPTCHQPVSDSLLAQNESPPPMSLEDNIRFIQEQIQTFSAMELHARRVLRAKKQQVLAMQNRANELREKIRAQKGTLISDARLPSLAAVQERVGLDSRIRELRKLEEAFEGCLDRLGELAAEWRVVQDKLRHFEKEDLSQSDKVKLEKLERCMIEQLHQYRLSSINPNELKISRETYRPTHDGFDLVFNLSASDNIRLIWSYLYGLLELSREAEINHLGLLVLDEPRQQQTDRVSFAEFAARASSAGGYGQQVIFATSEEEETLRKMLQGLPHQYIPFEGKMIARLAS